MAIAGNRPGANTISPVASSKREIARAERSTPSTATCRRRDHRLRDQPLIGVLAVAIASSPARSGAVRPSPMPERLVLRRRAFRPAGTTSCRTGRETGTRAANRAAPRRTTAPHGGRRASARRCRHRSGGAIARTAHCAFRGPRSATRSRCAAPARRSRRTKRASGNRTSWKLASSDMVVPQKVLAAARDRARQHAGDLRFGFAERGGVRRRHVEHDVDRRTAAGRSDAQPSVGRPLQRQDRLGCPPRPSARHCRPSESSSAPTRRRRRRTARHVRARRPWRTAGCRQARQAGRKTANRSATAAASAPACSAMPARLSPMRRSTSSSSLPLTAALFSAPVSCAPKLSDSFCRFSSAAWNGADVGLDRDRYLLSHASSSLSSPSG